MKIMAVDFGDVRTGLAVCDRTEFLASPVGVIEEKSFAKAAEKIVYATREFDVEMVVIGLPKNMDGSEGPRAEKCRRLAQTLISSKVIDLIELSDSYSIMEIDAPTSWRGRSLGQINVRAAYGVTVMAVRKSDQDLVISPPADYVVEPQDELIVVGQNDVISTISQ